MGMQQAPTGFCVGSLMTCQAGTELLGPSFWLLSTMTCHTESGSPVTWSLVAQSHGYLSEFLLK